MKRHNALTPAKIAKLHETQDITGGDIEVMRRSIAAKRALVLDAARNARTLTPDELKAAFEESWKRHEAEYRYLATEGMSVKELREALAEAQTENARLREKLGDDTVEVEKQGLGLIRKIGAMQARIARGGLVTAHPDDPSKAELVAEIRRLEEGQDGLLDIIDRAVKERDDLRTTLANVRELVTAALPLLTDMATAPWGQKPANQEAAKAWIAKWNEPQARDGADKEAK